MKTVSRNVKIVFHPILNVKKGIFHKWEIGSDSSKIYGYIEFQDGSFMHCDPTIIVFKDKNTNSDLVKIKFPNHEESINAYIHQFLVSTAVVELENGTVKIISSQWIEKNRKVA